MDFSKLETRGASEVGAFLHLVHPAHKTRLFDAAGEPVGIYLRGTESTTVRKLARKAAKRAAQSTDDDVGHDFLAALVIRFVGVERDGKLLGTDDADIRWFFGLSDSFGEQVLTFAQDRANFFEAASPA
jgi:hypothetical protein